MNYTQLSRSVVPARLHKEARTHHQNGQRAVVRFDVGQTQAAVGYRPKIDVLAVRVASGWCAKPHVAHGDSTSRDAEWHRQRGSPTGNRDPWKKTRQDMREDVRTHSSLWGEGGGGASRDHTGQQRARSSPPTGHADGVQWWPAFHEHCTCVVSSQQDQVNAFS